MGILVAGNDTSGQGVSAILATLQYFPQVMDKIRQEQQQVRHASASSSTSTSGTSTNSSKSK
jgi:cytochrome P450